MKTILNNGILLLTFLFALHIYSQNTDNQKSENSITPEDLKILIGDWNGSLTYIDYSSNNPFTMPANLSVKQGKNENQFVLYITYPNEPKANGKEKIIISKNGSQLNRNAIKSKELLADGQLQIITEYLGKDNNRNAKIKNIYLLGKNQFIIRKEVQFENSNEWLKRNEYNFNR